MALKRLCLTYKNLFLFYINTLADLLTYNFNYKLLILIS
jgi:hypothetical protein